MPTVKLMRLIGPWLATGYFTNSSVDKLNGNLRILFACNQVMTCASAVSLTFLTSCILRICYKFIGLCNTNCECSVYWHPQYVLLKR